MDGITFAFEVHSRRALFTDPVSKIGGEKMTYHLPTYQALKGITESIYWKPTLIWHIRRVRIMNPIRTEAVGIKPLKYHGPGNELSYYTYLTDVKYQVEIEYFWNLKRPELIKDRQHSKHNAIFRRMVEKGGRRDIFLGTRECQGYVKPCNFGEGEGYFDQIDRLDYGTMFHSFTYPDESLTPNEYGTLTVNLWNPVLERGILTFPAPEDCPLQRQIYDSKIKDFVPEMNVTVSEVLNDELD